MVAVDEQVAHPPPVPIEETAARDAAADVVGRAPGGTGHRAQVLLLHRTFREAYRRLAATPGSPESRSHAGEWLLDNQHVVLEALRQCAESLPRGYQRQLPRLVQGPLAGRPRVYAVARGSLAASDGHVDMERAARYVTAYQSVSPLSMGELWALPTMLRLAVLEDLAEAAAELAGPASGTDVGVAIGTSSRPGKAPDSPPGGALDYRRDEVWDPRPGEAPDSQPGDAPDRAPTDSPVPTILEDPAPVSLAIVGLRTLAAEDWKVFFEATSRVEEWLRKDPAKVYARMEFATRDAYRKAVERIARAAGRRDGEGEEAVARAAVELGREAGSADTRRAHVGWYLVDEGWSALEARIGAASRPLARLGRRLARHATALYVSGVGLVASSALAALLLHMVAQGSGPLQAAVAALLGAVPALTVAVGFVNWAVTHRVKPRLLPKLDLEDGIPDDLRTIVVVPCVFSSAEEARTLLRDLEVNYLANADPCLSLALLSDFPDAAQQHLPTDHALIATARAGIRELNERYGGGRLRPFHLFHRERRWNPGENRWMGWERKRGKLEEFNLLLGGAGDTSFVVHEGDPEVLSGVRYVITVDADTFLPPTAAARLLGTMAHPLNRAEFGPDGRVTAGYTVLQPRVETVPGGARHTLFSRVFEADTGLDLYTHAVSDVYQDLAGEGVFAGKGIYDPQAFSRALANRVPENALLSHDLFEGAHGRAGLVSDVAVFEQFPAHVLTYMRRLHRWVRGDWQLLPWLGARVPGAGGTRLSNPLSLLDRWKILDNLRRSLLAPTLLLLAVAGWLWLPGPAWLWTALVIGVLGTPIFLQGAATVNRVVKASRQRPSIGLTHEPPALWQGLRSLGANLWRWFLALAFLPFEAAVAGDAIGRTLFRLAVSRKRLLEWTTAAHSARALGSRTRAGLVWRNMLAAPITGLLVLGAVVWLRPAAIPAAAPLALLWIAAPAIAHRISRLIRPRAEPAPIEDRARLQLLARRTWLFFQHFLGPADHWLPPDNYQEQPGAIVARRTSPTNVGLAFLSALAAYDLGYAGALTMSATVRSTLESLERLERHRGHFLNWYDTRTLAPLSPRYVSTVDSGNLAASLLVLARGCLGLVAAPVVRPAQARGVLDTLSLLESAARSFDAPGLGPALKAVLDRTEEIRTLLTRTLAEGSSPELARIAAELVERDLPELEGRVVRLAESAPLGQDPGSLRELRIWTTALRRDLELLLREAEQLAPWLLLMREIPELYRQPDFEAAPAWRALADALPARPILGQVPKICRRARKRLAQLDARLESAGAGVEPNAPGAAAAASVSDAALVEAARAWNARLARALDEARQVAEHLLSALRDVARRCEPIVQAMDFGFLYDRRRGLFHIGYDVTAGADDPNYYDLLASEARLASFVAIAKGDVPPGHWLQLGRPFARVDGTRALLSWGGTMFEYLMPTLLMRAPDSALLAQSSRAAVRRQISYAEAHGAPWGISESGFADLDPRGNYQYRAFGVPGLGLKRDLGERLVVTPYASLLALPYAPAAVAQNLDRLAGLGMIGRYGLFEALDFGPSPTGLRAAAAGLRAAAGELRAAAGLPATGGGAAGDEQRVVRSYMAHHQGMILVALDNHLNEGPMVRRFHGEPRIATVEHVLHERIPWHVPLERPLAVAGDGRPRAFDLDRPAPAITWRPRMASAIPQVQALSNGRYTVMITAAGAGESRWKGLALTRWRRDATREEHGSWLYVQDLESNSLWSAAREPVAGGPAVQDVLFAPHMAEFHRRGDGLALRLEVTVAPDDDLEIRRVRLLNETGRLRRLALTSYAEVALAPHADDRRHPAFNKLFVESERLEGKDALIFRRRPRSAHEEPVWLLHAVVAAKGEVQTAAGWETDRGRFLGRGRTARSPAALEGGSLSGTTGATLDPVLALRQELELEPGKEIELAFLTAAGSSRAEVVARLEAYRSAARIEWSFEQARLRAERDLHETGIAPGRASALQELLSAALYPFHALRAPAETLAANVLSRRALWAHGVSGDLPIVHVRIAHVEGLPLVREVLEAHAWWRAHGVEIDLVILDLETGGYAQPVRERLTDAVAKTGGTPWLEQRGGIFLLPARTVEPEALALLESAAAVVLDADLSPLATQLAQLRDRPIELPGFVPLPSAPLEREPTPALEAPAGLGFENGWGGFTADGREYVIRIEPGQPTPAPWSNVIANPDFGFLVTESGGGFTWAAHSAENRLTPWRNDPVADLPGEALYLRDEETAEVWSPTPEPAGGERTHVVRHGAGYSVFEHNRSGLRQSLRLFAAPDAPVKLVQLRLTNVWKRHRRITATYYVEWTLGESREVSAPHVIPEFDRAAGALLARNPFNENFGGRVAFLATSDPVHGLTADRREFLGTGSDLRRPAALDRIGLSGTVRPGIDPCAALQVHVDLAPGESREVTFLLGQGRDRDEALRLVSRFREPTEVEAAWRRLGERWDALLGAVSVRTPDGAMDVMLNRWLLYQTLSCRIWGRSALYQSSGAFGFRDQLQDVTALLHTDPGAARAHILEAARHQFEEGDVLHWWHPPGGEGVRTRCSDDLLWLPYVTAAYLAATGDEAILDVEAPFLHAPPLAPDEHDRYARFEPGPETGTLYEHCLRAFRRCTATGRHGLPLIGSGDWNDGLDRVGIEGKGESVWLAWFLKATLLAFEPVCERRGDSATAMMLRSRARMLLEAVEKSGWDGGWYRRAYYDDGSPLGSASNREARLDNISQSWSVLAGGDPDRTRKAMQAVLDQLFDGSATARRAPRPGAVVSPGLLRLFWPPFDRTHRDPGYIKGYPPGVRENGGQYSHAAAWVGWALTEMGKGELAHEVFNALNPVSRAASRELATLYRVEPYVTVADVYSHRPHTGRGGWTWYTGSAAWAYRLGLEAILGIRRQGAALAIRPCIPSSWPAYEVAYRVGGATYRIRVENPDGVNSGVVAIRLDGSALEDDVLPLVDDGRVHEVSVRLGRGGGPR